MYFNLRGLLVRMMGNYIVPRILLMLAMYTSSVSSNVYFGRQLSVNLHLRDLNFIILIVNKYHYIREVSIANTNAHTYTRVCMCVCMMCMYVFVSAYVCMCGDFQN